MQNEIFLNEVKKCLDGGRRGSLPVPGKLDRSMRQCRREVKRNEASSCSINNRTGKDRNTHPLRDQRADHAHVSTLKDDLWKKTSFLRQVHHDLSQARSRLKEHKDFCLKCGPTDLFASLCWLLRISVPKKALMLALPILFLCIHASD
jgi:hypothetical protein